MKDHGFGEALFSVFCLFLARDECLLRQLNDFGKDIVVDGNECFFSIPALYAFVGTRVPEIGLIDYQSFRKMLFEYPFNRKLKSIGAKISISQNNRKIDLTIYRLSLV